MTYNLAADKSIGRAGHAELLAPACNYEGLRAVLGAGADAAYAGGKVFGARAYAGNFDNDELLQAIREVHILGKRLYITVNTLVKNKELYGELYNYLGPLYEAGLDAVLVQDFGILSFLRENFPDLPVHASTQMAVTGPEGMRFLEGCGVKRVVAARELGLQEIRRMHEASNVEVETFIHGALCYSYSGRCLMSSLIGGRSGNRGRCAQPCRLPYEVISPEGERSRGGKRSAAKGEMTPLSLKDMNTITILPDIVASGAASLKIEGRMKQKEYAAGVTAIYRKYLDIIENPGFSREDYQVDDYDLRQLNELFSRGGSCTGYYNDYHGKFMVDYYGSAKTGDADTVIRSPKAPLTGKICIKAGMPINLEISAGEVCVSAKGNVPEISKGRPADEAVIRKQLDRLGNTLFYWKNLEIELDEGLFVPAAQMNELRRRAIAELEENIDSSYRRVSKIRVESGAEEENRRRSDREELLSDTKERLALYASVEDEKTALRLLKEDDLCGIYVPLRFCERVLEERDLMLTRAEKQVPDVYVSLPMMSRNYPDDIISVLKGFLERRAKGFLVKDSEMLFAIVNAGLAEYVIADTSMYSWNDEAVKFLSELGVSRNTVPIELNEGEIRHRDNRNTEMIVYGYLPMMVSAQCVRANCFGCKGKHEELKLKDRYGNYFTVKCECTPWKGLATEKNTACYNIIYNSLPFGLPDAREKLMKCGIDSVRLSFTLESPDDAIALFRQYRDIYVYGIEASREEDVKLTKGHFKRGVQ